MPPFPPQDRLIRKETSLGTIRQLEPPQDHIGSLVAPMMEVPTDDVIFDYARTLTDGLAPARAEDAESELAQKDLLYGGVARASVIDWALKDHYNASAVNRYRESKVIQARLGVNSVADLPVTLQSILNEFDDKVARDDALRRRKLDNRIEWLIMQSVENNSIVYSDGKIKFTVTYGRPGGQTNQAPAGGLWTLTTSDPIGDIIAVQNFMFDTYGVRITRAITSRKVLLSILNSDRFAARSGLTGATGGKPVDPRYLIDSWGPQAAQDVVERVTGLRFIEYDAVYKTRPVGSTVVTNNRFLTDKKVYFLPDTASVDDLDDAIGFGKTLTSPHPEGNWTPGFYEWEEETKDPWGRNRGTGIKAFPVFPHMDWTYTMTVLP